MFVVYQKIAEWSLFFLPVLKKQTAAWHVFFFYMYLTLKKVPCLARGLQVIQNKQILCLTVRKIDVWAGCKNNTSWAPVRLVLACACAQYYQSSLNALWTAKVNSQGRWHCVNMQADLSLRCKLTLTRFCCAQGRSFSLEQRPVGWDSFFNVFMGKP